MTVTDSRIEDASLKAATLIEALPWLNRFHGQTVVIKYGGHAMTDEALRLAFAQDLVFLTFAGEEVTGAEDVDAGAAGAGAAVLAVAQELSGLNCRVIDLDPATSAQSLPILAREIVFGCESQCAIRGRRRFVADSHRLTVPRGDRAFRQRGRPAAKSDAATRREADAARRADAEYPPR